MFTIGPVRSSDVPEVLALLEQCQLPTAGVAENLDAFLLARAQGVCIGAAGVERYGSAGLLRSVAVAPTSRGLGIATALVEQLLARAQRDGLSALYLLTTTARGYFEGHGFAVCARDEAPAGIRDSWEFRSGCPSSAVLLRRELSAS